MDLRDFWMQQVVGYVNQQNEIVFFNLSKKVGK